MKNVSKVLNSSENIMENGSFAQEQMLYFHSENIMENGAFALKQMLHFQIHDISKAFILSWSLIME